MSNAQYGSTVFQSVGISDSYVTQIILGAVNFGCTFLGIYIMEKVSLNARSIFPVRLQESHSSVVVGLS